MKVNEAPEKIYVHVRANKELGTTWHGTWIGVNDIEYIRKDAFIDKVESFLNKKDDRDSYTIGYIKRHLEEIIKEIGL